MEKTVKEKEIASVERIMTRAYFQGEYRNEATLLVFADGNVVVFKRDKIEILESVSLYVNLAQRERVSIVSISNVHYFDEMTLKDWGKELGRIIKELRA